MVTVAKDTDLNVRLSGIFPGSELITRDQHCVSTDKFADKITEVEI